MLEKSFQAKFFAQVTGMTPEVLSEKIEAVEKTAKHFDRGTEASSDSFFMLRHMRRIRMEMMFSQNEQLKH